MSSSPWRCTECGAPATMRQPSLDPAHPLGECLHPLKPCGRAPAPRGPRGTKLPPHARALVRLVPLVRELPELAAVLRAHDETRHRKAHARHLSRSGKLIKSCAWCQELRQAQAARLATR